MTDAPIDAASESARQTKLRECAAIQRSRNWGGLKICALELDRMGETLGVRYRETAAGEAIAEANLHTLHELEKELDLLRADRLLEAIPKVSVYHDDAVATRDRIKTKLIDREVVAVNAIKSDCGKYKQRLHELDARYGKEIAVQVAGEAAPCGSAVATRPTRVLPVPQIPPVTNPPCSEPAIKAQRLKGNALLAALDYNQATSVFDSLAVCDPSAHEQAYIAACHAGLFPVAKRHFAAIANKQLAKICLAHGFDPRDGAPQAPATTKQDVERVLDGLKIKARECGARHTARGRIELIVVLGSTGLRSAIASPPSDTAKCIELAARATTFPPWQSGSATFRMTYEVAD